MSVLNELIKGNSEKCYNCFQLLYGDFCTCKENHLTFIRLVSIRLVAVYRDAYKLNPPYYHQFIFSGYDSQEIRGFSDY